MASVTVAGSLALGSDAAAARRKLPEPRRIDFVLHRFREVVDWLDREAADFFAGLKRDL